MAKALVETEVEIDIPFHDIDVMRVAWHGHYAKYIEIARCKLLDEVDYNFPQMEASGYAWPVIDMRIRYARPLRFQQKAIVIAKLVEWENRLKIDYVIQDAETKQRLTKAYTVQVAVDIHTHEMLYASPSVLFEKLGVSEDA